MEKGAFIIGMNETGEKVSASGARISTTGGNAVSILEKAKDVQKNRNLIARVLKSGHASISEHTVFNLAFCDVSVLVEQFMIEFRLASFTVKSRRYVDFGQSGFYTPPTLPEPLKETYTAHMESLFSAYNDMVERGIPKEDARFVLPYCFYSNFYVTLNARELKHILAKMLFGHGAVFAEIRNLGQMLLEQALEMSPCFFESLKESKQIQKHYAVESSNKRENIEILHSPKDAERILAIAHLTAKGESPDVDKLTKQDEQQIIADIFKSDRPRELEQLYYTIRFNNLSLSGITHLVRHRMQSIIVPSLLSVNNAKYIIPKTIEENAKCLETYQSAFRDTIELRALCKQEGATDSDLVYFALSGNTLDVMTTMNVRELLFFFQLRTCNRAQWEIREYAIDLLETLRESSGRIFSFIGPSCFVRGMCPEGKMSCGKMEQIVERFG